MTESEIHETFSRMLQYYMELSDMKQIDLAKKMGISTSTANDWVKGNKIPRMSRIDKLCTIFGCKRSDLLEKPSDKHSDFISAYNSLNQEGQQKVMAYMSDLINSGRYKKHSINSMVEGA